jgi:hypothetical protein
VTSEEKRATFKHDMDKPGDFPLRRVSTDYVSLACRPGKLLVRAVYKVFALPSSGKVGPLLNLGGDRDELGFLGSNPSPVRRCDLELPPFTPTPAAEQAARGDVWDSEKDAAVRSKELNCKEATGFTNLQVGRWYSDTATFDFAGCEGLKKPGARYGPTRPYALHWVYSGVDFTVIKFEVQEV